MHEEEKKCSETEQFDGQHEPGEWLTRLRNFMVVERQKNRPRGKHAQPRNEPTPNARIAEVQLLESHIGSWLSRIIMVVAIIHVHDIHLPIAVWLKRSILSFFV